MFFNCRVKFMLKSVRAISAPLLLLLAASCAQVLSEADATLDKPFDLFDGVDQDAMDIPFDDAAMDFPLTDEITGDLPYEDIPAWDADVPVPDMPPDIADVDMGSDFPDDDDWDDLYDDDLYDDTDMIDDPLLPDGPSLTSPVRGELTSGCDMPYADAWAFIAAIGDTIVIRADTVSSSTASDLYAAAVGNLADPEYSVIDSGDDEFFCTYPPPDYDCPEFTFTVDSDYFGTLYAFVGQYWDCADSMLGEYELSVTVNGIHTELTLVADEIEFNW